MDIIKEACVEGCEEAIQAKIMGADRIELCSSLHEDGLTPERKTMTSVLEAINIPVKIMIRPRPGNFEITLINSSISAKLFIVRMAT